VQPWASRSHSRTSVVKLCDFVSTSGGDVSAANRIGLASHWPCVTDTVVAYIPV